MALLAMSRLASAEVEAQVSSELELAAGRMGRSSVERPSDGSRCMCSAGAGVVRRAPDADSRYATRAIIPIAADRKIASRRKEWRRSSDPTPLWRDRFQTPAPAQRVIALP